MERAVPTTGSCPIHHLNQLPVARPKGIFYDLKAPQLAADPGSITASDGPGPLGVPTPIELSSPSTTNATTDRMRAKFLRRTRPKPN